MRKIAAILMMGLMMGVAMADAQTTQPPANVSINTGGSAAGESSGRSQRRRHNDRQDAPVSPSDSMSVQTPPPMSGDFHILLERSLFYHGHFVPTDPTHPSASAGPAQPSPVEDAFRPENNIVFCGVTTQGKVTQVLLEDISTFKTEMVDVGAVVAPGMGKITKAEFDDLVYQMGGKTIVVRLGENLLGSPVDLSTTQPTVVDTGGEPGFGDTSGGGSSSSGDQSSGAMADIIARLKAKRAAELGH
jgi:hypothetical protein